QSAYICSNTGVHDLRGLCGSSIWLTMIKDKSDKGTLALSLIRQPDTPILAATKGPANSNQKSSDRRKTLQGNGIITAPSHRCVSCDWRRKPTTTLGWLLVTVRNSQQNYTRDSQTAAAGWRANLIGPVRISYPPRASPSCIQIDPHAAWATKRYDIRLARPAYYAHMFLGLLVP
ncbi:unnamed protein product, partial [Aureobasidium vineae]